MDFNFSCSKVVVDNINEVKLETTETLTLFLQLNILIVVQFFYRYGNL